MAAQVYPSSIRLQFSYPHSNFNQPRFSSFSLRSPRLQPIICSASDVKQKKHSSSSSTKNNNKKNSNKSGTEASGSNSASDSSPPQIPTQLPTPPAGFVVDDSGKLLAVSDDRFVTLVDPTNNLPFKCVIRRVFTSSQGDQCLLLCPLDMPVKVLQSTGDGWSEVSYEEIEPLLPAAAFALAKLRIDLVYSGYCYTARGGFCYSEEDILEFCADGQGGGLATEGVKITYFNQGGEHYMIYTPCDPLVLVAAKDQNGMLQIADEELLEDPAVTRARDEETEFNALVDEEEAALVESLQ